MRAVLGLLPALACFGMLFVCARMMFGRRGADASQQDEISQLRVENARLRAEQQDSNRQDTRP